MSSDDNDDYSDDDLFGSPTSLTDDDNDDGDDVNDDEEDDVDEYPEDDDDGDNDDGGAAPFATAAMPVSRAMAAPRATNAPVKNPCDWCHAKSKFVDKGSSLPYCGKTCAHKARGATDLETPTLCIIPGCPKKVWSPRSGPKSKYCGKTHLQLGKVACLWCRKRKKAGQHNFCSVSCASMAEALAPFLIEMYKGHVTYDSVARQFNSKWLHPPAPGKQKGTAKKIYKIVEKPAFRASYDKYRAALEAKGHFKGKNGMSAGNERRRWHGTARNCHLGDQNQLQLCNLPVCPICSITRTSFDLKYFTKWGRFGKGIYTSATSSKSNDYITGTTVPYKAIFLASVAVGRASIQYTDNPNLTQPPAGYDSVIGQPKQGGSLNYDELIVYTNDAIRPSYVVMYAQ